MRVVSSSKHQSKRIGREIRTEEDKPYNVMNHFASLFKGKKPYSDLEDDGGRMSPEVDERDERSDMMFSPLPIEKVNSRYANTIDVDDFNDQASAVSWDTSNSVQSVSTVGSANTINTNTYFGLSSYFGKGKSDLTLDAFIGIEQDIENSMENDMEATKSKKKPHPVPTKLADLHATALACIFENDFTKFLQIVKQHPSLLLCKCKKQEGRESRQKKGSRGCYGGTMLHVLVSQRPSLKKKKIGKRNDLNVTGGSYEVHVMPTIPESVLLHVIKSGPKALAMADDFGRLPLHCATLSLATHLEEMSKFAGLTGAESSSSTNAKRKYTIARYVIREVNYVHILLKAFRKTASIMDDKGNLPLHYAAMMGPDYQDTALTTFTKSKKSGNPSAIETVKKLLEAYPRGVGIENRYGQLPIHIMCTKGILINQPCLKALLQLHQQQRDVPSDRDRNGDSPLQIAIKNRAPYEVIKMFASFDTSNSSRLFIQRDRDDNNALHIALQLKPPAEYDIISSILSYAPSTASFPDSKGMMPIRYAVRARMPSDIVRSMLSRDMPIELGAGTDNSTTIFFSSNTLTKVAKHVVERSHQHSWWHIVAESHDLYLEMVKEYLTDEATHSQIVTLARQVGPDGKAVLINNISPKCRLMFHFLLRFYDRYEILLSSFDAQRDTSDIQVFHALDYGPSASGNQSGGKEKAGSTAVKVRNTSSSDTTVEVSLLSAEKSKVLLRCYHYEAAFFAELKVRDQYDLSSKFVEEIYNSHRDEYYSHLTLSKAEKLCCISFERPDHTLAEVFAAVSGGNRSRKWIEKCYIVLKQLVTGLKHLHDKGLIHGHLSSTNVAKFGNVWKLGSVGTVIPMGATMRGPMRPCVPPEAVSELPSSRSTSRTISFGKKTPSTPNRQGSRVKFSSQIATTNEDVEQITKGESDDSSVMNMFNFSSWGREGTDTNNIDQLKTSSPSRKPKKVTSKNSAAVEQNCNNWNQPRAQDLSFVPEKFIASIQWDMWGLGLIMVQLLLGRCTHLPNFEKADDAILMKLRMFDEASLNKIASQVDKIVGKDAAGLVINLLQRDPSKRPRSMDQVLSHKYFMA